MPTATPSPTTYDETEGSGLDADLASVAYADGSSQHYLYNETDYVGGKKKPHFLTGIVDENGQRFATYRYNFDGFAIGTEHAGGVDKTTLTDILSTSTAINDALGSKRYYRFADVNGVRRLTGVQQPPGAGCPSAATALTYDDNGRVATRKDFNGNLTHYAYTDDGRSLEAVRIEAFGSAYERTILTQWHPQFRLPTRITVTATDADAAAADERNTSLSYDDHGNLLNLTSGTAAPRAWRFTYDGGGRVLTAQNPRTDVEGDHPFQLLPQRCGRLR